METWSIYCFMPLIIQLVISSVGWHEIHETRHSDTFYYVNMPVAKGAGGGELGYGWGLLRSRV